MHVSVRCQRISSDGSPCPPPGLRQGPLSAAVYARPVAQRLKPQYSAIVTSHLTIGMLGNMCTTTSSFPCLGSERRSVVNSKCFPQVPSSQSSNDPFFFFFKCTNCTHLFVQCVTVVVEKYDLSQRLWDILTCS